MNKGLIIFSRMSSSRLPGKALLEIGTRPLLGHVVDRARLCQNATQVVVATSDQKSDDAIEQWCQKEQVPVFRGSLNNLVERAYECMKHFNFDYAARICGDRLFLDYESIDQAFMVCEGFDLVTNKNLNPIPGMTTEIISREMLAKLQGLKLSSACREHLTQYLYENQGEWKMKYLDTMPEISKKLRLVIDNEDDLAFGKKVIGHLEQKLGPRFQQDFSYQILEQIAEG